MKVADRQMDETIGRQRNRWTNGQTDNWMQRQLDVRVDRKKER